MCKSQFSAAYPLLKDNLGTLAEAVTVCYSLEGCWGISATKRDENPDIYTGINTFIGCLPPDPEAQKRYNEGKWTKIYTRAWGTETLMKYKLFNAFGLHPKRPNVEISKSNYQQFLFYSTVVNVDEYVGVLSKLNINPDPEGIKFSRGKENWQQEQWDVYNKMVNRISGLWGVCQPQGHGGCEEGGCPHKGLKCNEDPIGGCNTDPAAQFTESCQCSLDSYAMNPFNRDENNGVQPWLMHGPIGPKNCSAKEKILEDRICDLCRTPKCHWLYLRKGFQLKSNCPKGYMYGDNLEESMDNWYNHRCRHPDVRAGKIFEPFCTCNCPQWMINSRSPQCDLVTKKVTNFKFKSPGFDCGKYEKYLLDNNQTNKDIADNRVKNQIGPDGKSTCGYEFDWNEELINIYDTPLCKRCEARTDIKPIEFEDKLPKVDPDGVLRDVGESFCSSQSRQ